MCKRSGFSLLLAVAVLVLSTQGALAQDEWHFGIGTGFGTLALDGDLGFRGFKRDIDLDNSETSDLVESAFGLGGFASKGNWAILWSAGTLTLEDDDKGLEAEWDRVAVELAGVYSFVNSERNRLGVLFGVRYIDHDWDFRLSGVSGSVEIDESWTDAIVGLTYTLKFAQKWGWASRIDAGFGDSEGTFLVKTGLDWHFAKHWQASVHVKNMAVDFENGSRGDSDFYLYDVDETGAGLGIMVIW